MIDRLNRAGCSGVGVILLAIAAALPLSAQASHTKPIPLLKDMETSIVSIVGNQRIATKTQNGDSVALVVRDSAISYIVIALAHQAGFRIVYDMSNPNFRKRISVNIAKMPVMAAFAQALKGTGLTATIASSGEVIVVRSVSDSSQTKPAGAQKGQVTGQIRDSSSGKGVDGAVVSIPGAALSVTTDGGKFTIHNVPAGEHQVNVKVFGYKPITRVVSVTEGKSSTLHVQITPVPTQLSGVVTTATGEQRKIEVGNDITTIKVDEVIKTMPVSTMSDLLATRVPGLYAAPTSGAPGAPTRIRIRGLSSINATNDPIVILDGVRVYGEQVARSSNLVGITMQSGSAMVPSPLDQIDPNSVETVEILKGPSAVALYGSEAANGVIVITSKRGRVGAPEWSVQTQFATTTIPGKWPSNYWMWGHPWYDEGLAMRCDVEGQGDACFADSLVTYQILNDPRTTAFSRGTVQSYRADVRGGSKGFTYALSGSVQNELGLVKMPDADVAVLRKQRVAIPSWQRRPQGDDRQSAQATLGFDVGSSSVFTVTTALSRAFTRTTPLQDAINRAERMPLAVASDPNDSLSGSGLLMEIPDFRFRMSSRSLKSTHVADLRSNFGYDISTQATLGVDLMSRKDLATHGNGDCYVLTKCGLSGEYNDGVYNTADAASDVATVNLRASKPITWAGRISARTSLGGNYTRTTVNDTRNLASGLPVGATSSHGAQTSSWLETRDDRSTAGVYLETVLGFGNRLYLPLAIRRDVGSALGSEVAPLFPKLSFSYLLSDEPWFQSLPAIGRLSTLRLRLAYGQAGVQPAADKRLRTYRERQVILDGTSTSIIRIASVGNSFLNPERSREYEGGFDTDFLNNRLNISVTAYKKNTYDLLVNEAVPGSLGFEGGGVQQFNLGDITNSGIEVSLGGTFIETRYVRFQSNIGLTRQRNRLIRFGSLADDSRKGNTNAQGNKFVVGYPLYGIWQRPISEYTDVNQDGIIQSQELQHSDSLMYVGAPYPSFTSSMNNTISLFTRVVIGTTFSYQHGLTQSDEWEGRIETNRAANDPSLPLDQQVYLRYSGLRGNQTVSRLRFDALSIGYIVPRTVSGTVFGQRTVRVALQGTNIGLWTNYNGKDPNVSGSMGEGSMNRGALPQPRRWQISLGVN